MKYLVDANIISEGMKAVPDKNVTDWHWKNAEEIITCSIVIGEIQRGIHLLPDGRRKNLFQDWLDRLKRNVLSVSFTNVTADWWAEITANAAKNGKRVATADSMIAACAAEHGLIIATRNVSDFVNCGVKIINPFEEASDV